MLAFIFISLLFELFLILFTGFLVNHGNYGTAAVTALCAIVLAIYSAAIFLKRD